MSYTSIYIFWLFWLNATSPYEAGTCLTGKWQGYLTQNESGLANKYPFEMQIIHNGKTLEGFSTIHLADRPQYLGKMSFRGFWNAKNEIFEFTEIKIEQQNILPSMFWCIKNGKLQYKYDKKTLQLQGDWKGCLPKSTKSEGKIYLEMK